MVIWVTLIDDLLLKIEDKLVVAVDISIDVVGEIIDDFLTVDASFVNVMDEPLDDSVLVIELSSLDNGLDGIVDVWL